MVKKSGPYAGVTGFTSQTQVEVALAIIPKEPARKLMVGVLMSSKTLAGKQNKWPSRYPTREAISDIFVDDPRALNLVHYSTDHPETLFSQLDKITQLAGHSLDGFQLNIPWPPISQLEDWWETHRDQFLLLQIGNGAVAQAKSMEHFAELLGHYVPMVDAILIDSSGGRGEPLDPVKAAEYLKVSSEYTTLGLGVAGGLGPLTLHLLDPLIKEYPELSIDAEGQLRTLEDRLSLSAMRDYLDDAFPILAGEKRPGLIMRRYDHPYGLDGHLLRHGSGANMLRTPRLAQPKALEVGDILATGERVLSPPREGGNGRVLIHLSGKFQGDWIDVAARIPIALLIKEDNAPEGYEKLSTS